MDTFPRGTSAEASLDPWFVTGLVEGTGSFTFSRSGSGLVVSFGIKRPARDRPLLDEVQAFFGVGTIYTVGGGRAAFYRVTHRNDLSAVVGHFDQHPLRGSKRAAFDVWREMVALKQETFRRPPNERLEELAQALSALNGSGES